MKLEKSCGAVVFNRERETLRYVIIQSKGGFYGFPKGHMEGTETEQETALREIWEETGLQVDLLGGFRAEDAYPLLREGKPDVVKQVVYFLAEYRNQTPVAQDSELDAIHLMDFDTAMASLQFESSRRILLQAHIFLTGQTP